MNANTNSKDRKRMAARILRPYFPDPPSDGYPSPSVGSGKPIRSAIWLAITTGKYYFFLHHFKILRFLQKKNRKAFDLPVLKKLI